MLNLWKCFKEKVSWQKIVFPPLSFIHHRISQETTYLVVSQLPCVVPHSVWFVSGFGGIDLEA